MTVKLSAQKAKNKAEEAVVIDRMRLTCEREIAVAVSDATVHLTNDLKKSMRGVMGLQRTLNKSEVYSFFCHVTQSVKPSPFFLGFRVSTYLFFYSIFFCRCRIISSCKTLYIVHLKLTKWRLY